MIENIFFDSNDEKNRYEQYLIVRGIGVYKHVYDALTTMTGSKIINSTNFNDFIQYDKRLRDNLYKFLATVEEYLREQLWKQLEYTGMDIIRTFKENEQERSFNKNTEYGYNFYKYASFDFCSLISFIEHHDINIYCSDNEKHLSEHLFNVKELRNRVMHHNLLLLDIKKSTTKENIESNVEDIENYIHSLTKLIPDPWNKGLIHNLNSCNNKKDSKLLLSTHIKLKYLEV